jgi:hypothetical protein
MFFIFYILTQALLVYSSSLSLELCGCNYGCLNMDQVYKIPYEFNYVKKNLVLVNEYDYMAYLGVSGNIVYVSATQDPVDCSYSDITIDNIHYPLINYSPSICYYNGTFSTAFLSLRNLVFNTGTYNGFLIYYDDIIPTKRELCGWCECNQSCDYGIGLSVSFIIIIISAYILYKYLNYKKKSIKINLINKAQ